MQQRQPTRLNLNFLQKVCETLRHQSTRMKLFSTQITLLTQLVSTEGDVGVCICWFLMTCRLSIRFIVFPVDFCQAFLGFLFNSLDVDLLINSHFWMEKESLRFLMVQLNSSIRNWLHDQSFCSLSYCVPYTTICILHSNVCQPRYKKST